MTKTEAGEPGWNTRSTRLKRRPHARNGYRLCAVRMQNMTFHDTAQAPRMTEHDIS